MSHRERIVQGMIIAILLPLIMIPFAFLMIIGGPFLGVCRIFNLFPEIFEKKEGEK